MGKTIRYIAGILAVIFLNGFGFAGHTAATSIHDMHGTSHEQTNSSNCVTLCRTAVVESKELGSKETEAENDDEPIIPFYLQFQNQLIDISKSTTKTCLTSIKPPPKVPIYILHCVSRN